MAIVEIYDWDNFAQWRAKANLLGQSIGDLDLLDPGFFSPLPTNLVDAINEVVGGSSDKDRETLVRAIAMA
jgi:hypothetical protein